MSILIKGMEMPKSCGECLNIGWHYVFECRLDDVEEGKKLQNCPLVPVPPHGRLIDADEAICHLFNGEQCLYSWDEIEDAIDATETIIPAEEGET